jgi:hypothetical protein
VTLISYAGGDAVLLALFIGLSVLSVFAFQKVRDSVDWKAPLKALKSYAWELRRQDLIPICFLVVWLLTITLITSIFSIGVEGLLKNRYAIAGSVALYLLVARGITNINYKPAKVAVIGVVILLSVTPVVAPQASSEIWKHPQAREAIQFIDANAKSGDVVLLWPEFQGIPFFYYNNRSDITIRSIEFYAGNTLERNGRLGTAGIMSPEAKTQLLQSYVDGSDRVWLLDDYASSTGSIWIGGSTANFTLDFLNQSYARTNSQHFLGYDVYLYEKRA